MIINGEANGKQEVFQRKLAERQFRTLTMDGKPSEDHHIVEGYAATWERYLLYEDGDRKVYEKFERSAFNDADMSDVIFLFDHVGRVLARTTNGSLAVEPDETGLFVRADLSKTTAAREMCEEIRQGLVTKMSWSFALGDTDYDEFTSTIIHKTVPKVYDVSAVTYPANNQTTIQARSWADGVIRSREAERLQRAEELKKKQRLALLARIIQAKGENTHV